MLAGQWLISRKLARPETALDDLETTLMELEAEGSDEDTSIQEFALAHWRSRPIGYDPNGASGGVGMQTVFIMVKCELGKAYDVADGLVQNLEQVSEVHSISGQYDLLVKCYLADNDDLGHFVTDRIQTQPGIKDTFTLVGYKAFS